MQGPLRDGVNECRRAIGLGDIGSWSDWFALPSMFVGSWARPFAEPSNTWPAEVHALGFVPCDDVEHDPLPGPLEDWLASGARPILITGGTARWDLSERFYRTAIDACRLTGHRAIVVYPHDAGVTRDERDHVVWFRRLPFATLMPRLAAVIHHGGSSVQVRAMKARLPQLLMPFGGDRPDTAMRLARLGGAECIPPASWHAEHVAVRLRALLASDQVRAACERLTGLVQASAGSLSAGCDAILELAARGRAGQPCGPV